MKRWRGVLWICGLSVCGCGQSLNGGDDAATSVDLATAVDAAPATRDLSSARIDLRTTRADLSIAPPDLVAANDLTMSVDAGVDAATPDLAMPDLAMPDLASPDLAPTDLAARDGTPPGSSPSDGGLDLADANPIDAPTMDLSPTSPPPGDLAPSDFATSDLTTPVDLLPVDLLPAPMSCYSAAPATEGVGTCRAGTKRWDATSGTYGPCVGEIDPGPESCNGLDDDCDGAVDDGLGKVTCGVGACALTVDACAAGKASTCVPAAPTSEICGNGIDDSCDGVVDEGCDCVYVSPAGIDAGNTSGSATQPLRSIAAGIALAALAQPKKSVCVASGAACPSTANYSESITMVDGVSVIGGFQQTAAAPWPRGATCLTAILDGSATGVLFPETVTSPTALAGFTVIGPNVNTFTGVGAAVTVQGSTGAVLSGDILQGGAGATTYGVNILPSSTGAPARPLLTRSAVVGGSGATLAVGVRVKSSQPTIVDNCTGYLSMTGECFDACPAAGAITPPPPGIQGRAQSGSAGPETDGILLDGSPGTTVARSLVCAAYGAQKNYGVRVTGDGTGVAIWKSSVHGAGGAQNAAGVWLDPCAGASPWIFDNDTIGASGGTSATGRNDGVHAAGDCHPRIDGNLRIVAGEVAAPGTSVGISCWRDAGGTASRCQILGNVDVWGAVAGGATTGGGIYCDDGTCPRVEKNALVNVGSATTTFGLWLGATGSFVARNIVKSGCATQSGNGLLTNNAWARIENNEFDGPVECAAGYPHLANGANIYLGSGAHEIDLHSNDVFARGSVNNPCNGASLAYEATGLPPSGPRGLVRNNLLDAGDCNVNYSVAELTHNARPRVFENNDLWNPQIDPVMRYLFLEDNATAYEVVGSVNALKSPAGIQYSGNIDGDPILSGGSPNIQISSGSPCENTGTAEGAPATDYRGAARPDRGAFDIGMWEF